MNPKLPPKSPASTQRLLIVKKGLNSIDIKKHQKFDLLLKPPTKFLPASETDRLKNLTPTPKLQKDRKVQKLSSSPFQIEGSPTPKPIPKRSKSEKQVQNSKKSLSNLLLSTKPKPRSKDQEVKAFNKQIKHLRSLFTKNLQSDNPNCNKLTKRKKNHQISPKAKLIKSKLNIKEKRKQRTIKKDSKLNDLNEDLLNKAATKIQSCFKGYLVRKIFKAFIKHQLEVLNEQSKKIVNLAEIESYNSNFSFSFIRNSVDAFVESIEISTPSFYCSSFEEAAEKLVLVLRKKSVLRNLEDEDLRVMDEWLGNLNYRVEVRELLLKVVRRRYKKLHEHFDIWLDKLKSTFRHLIEIEYSSSKSVLSQKQIKDRIRNHSTALCTDIEHLWERIDVINGNQDLLSNFASSLHTFNIIDATELRVSGNLHLTEAKSDSAENTISLFESSKGYQSIFKFEQEEIKVSEKPEIKTSQNESKSDVSKSNVFINIVQGSSSMSLENSKALKEYSSIQLVQDFEPINENSSIRNDLNLQPSPSPRQTMWPSGSRSIFDYESASNPLSGTSHFERQYDASEINLVVDRAMINLEFAIFHEILDDHLSIFEDISFTLKMTEDFIMKKISNFIAEAVRPRVVRQSTQPQVRTDTLSMLSYIDRVFREALKHPKNFKAKLLKTFNYEKYSQYLRSNIKLNPSSLHIFPTKHKKQDIYIEIYEKALTQSCSELLYSKLESQKSTIFDLLLFKISSIKLADIFVEIRETLSKWNEIRSGNLPLGDTIRPNGELDDQKLFLKRAESLNKMIYAEILYEERCWADQIYEEEQIIEWLESIILSNLVDELSLIL